MPGGSGIAVQPVTSRVVLSSIELVSHLSVPHWKSCQHVTLHNVELAEGVQIMMSTISAFA
jgi:hypothetical protein